MANDTSTIIIPEVVIGTRSLANLLHGQRGLALKVALLDRADTVVTSAPFVPIASPGAAGRRGSQVQPERQDPEPELSIPPIGLHP